MAEKKSRSGCGTILAVFLLIVVLGVLFSDGTDSNRSTDQPPVSDRSDSSPSANEPDKHAAWVMAQQFIEDRLKSPSTADFGSIFGDYQKPDEQVSYLGNNEFEVHGWVDSENAFGATVRTHFTMKLKQDGDTWTVIEGPVMQQR